MAARKRSAEAKREEQEEGPKVSSLLSEMELLGFVWVADSGRFCLILPS
jgi:hypothetical protein